MTRSASPIAEYRLTVIGVVERCAFSASEMTCLYISTHISECESDLREEKVRERQKQTFKSYQVFDFQSFSPLFSEQKAKATNHIKPPFRERQEV